MYIFIIISLLKNYLSRDTVLLSKYPNLRHGLYSVQQAQYR